MFAAYGGQTMENSDMGYRLSKITTKTGDSGETSLATGTRVQKNSPYIIALGEVDELNCVLGMLASKPLSPDVRRVITAVQNDLFDLGAELSQPGRSILASERVESLGQLVERFNAGLPPLEEFILPGGSETAAICHVARATCRSVERGIVSLEDIDPAESSVRLPYLNRLSDLLFVLARVLNVESGTAEVNWSSPVSRTPKL